eukprot:gene9119-biopygen19694
MWRRHSSSVLPQCECRGRECLKSDQTCGCCFRGKRGPRRANTADGQVWLVHLCQLMPRRTWRPVGRPEDKVPWGKWLRTRPGRVRFFKFYRRGRVRGTSAAVPPWFVAVVWLGLWGTGSYRLSRSSSRRTAWRLEARGTSHRVTGSPGMPGARLRRRWPTGVQFLAQHGPATSLLGSAPIFPKRCWTTPGLLWTLAGKRRPNGDSPVLAGDPREVPPPPPPPTPQDSWNLGPWPPPPGPPGSPGALFRRGWSVRARGVPGLFQHLFGEIGIRYLQRGAGTGPALHDP